MKNMIIIIFTAMLFSGCVHTAGQYSMYHLKIGLPSGFVEQHELSGEAPDGWRHIVWAGPDDSKLQVMTWPHYPKTDGGPMIITSEEPILVAGQQTRLITTKRFFGRTKETLVVHLKQGDTRYIVFAEKMKPKRFKSILKSISIAENSSQKPAETTDK